MQKSIAYTSVEGVEITNLLNQNPNIQHLLPEIQFISDSMGAKKALLFLHQRLDIHLAVEANTSPRYKIK